MSAQVSSPKNRECSVPVFLLIRCTPRRRVRRRWQRREYEQRLEGNAWPPSGVHVGAASATGGPAATRRRMNPTHSVATGHITMKLDKTLRRAARTAFEPTTARASLAVWRTDENPWTPVFSCASVHSFWEQHAMKPRRGWGLKIVSCHVRRLFLAGFCRHGDSGFWNRLIKRAYLLHKGNIDYAWDGWWGENNRGSDLWCGNTHGFNSLQCHSHHFSGDNNSQLVLLIATSLSYLVVASDTFSPFLNLVIKKMQY
jgi:hypothetical protein